MELENIHKDYRETVTEAEKYKELYRISQRKLGIQQEHTASWKSKYKTATKTEPILKAQNMVLLKKVVKQQEYIIGLENERSVEIMLSDPKTLANLDKM